MEPYFFQGVVLPERAQITLKFGFGFIHGVSGVAGTIKVSILLNQVAAWVESEHAWGIFDLRNAVKGIIQTQLAMVGYLKGFAYEVEITRVVHQGRGIDYIFGIEIPCIAKRNEGIDVQDALSKLQTKVAGPNGMLLHRCFNDLVSAMKNADDTGFYCYRALESLRHHCAAVNNLTAANRSTQWERFREVAGCEEGTVRAIEDAAVPLRHGEVATGTEADRVRLFTTTWGIVDAYLATVTPVVALPQERQAE